MKIDMHIHTSASDGTWTPEELIHNIIRHDIKIFSVTDHNTIKHVPAVFALAENHQLKCIPGVEISVKFQNETYHILGYGIDIENPVLLKALNDSQQAIENTDITSIQYLENKGLPVSVSAYHQYKNDPTRGGWKALNYLIDAGLCTNYIDFFSLFKEIGNPLNKAECIPPEQAIVAIKAAGGFPVLAHPGASFYDPDYQKIIDVMYQKGVVGIECFHPDNNEEISEYCVRFCRKNNLMMTGGSDCHGDFVKTRSLGKPNLKLTDLWLHKLLN